SDREALLSACLGLSDVSNPFRPLSVAIKCEGALFSEQCRAAATRELFTPPAPEGEREMPTKEKGEREREYSRAKGNIWFLSHFAEPLFKGLSPILSLAEEGIEGVEGEREGDGSLLQWLGDNLTNSTEYWTSRRLELESERERETQGVVSPGVVYTP
ncbi:hypothetical protein KIPB_001292, partial [Kipferlia bialata]